MYRVQLPAGTAAGQYAVGRIDLAEGRVDAAIVRFRNALKLDAGFVEAHNGLGVALGMQGRFGEATEAFHSALALGPASAHLLNNIGFAQMKAGRLNEAWRSFGQSLDLDPKNASTRENVRLLALQRGERLASTTDASAPKATVAKSSAVSATTKAKMEGSMTIVPTMKARGDATPGAAGERAAVPPLQPETVLSVSDNSALVQLSTNVYELRPIRRQAQVAAAERVQTAAASNNAVTSAPVVSIAVAPLDTSATRSAPEAMLVPEPSNSIVSAAAAKAPSTVAATSLSTAVPSRPHKPAAQSSSQRAAPRWVSRFEVSNGAGVERLAARTATELARAGIGISRVSNFESFDRVATEIHYRKGFIEDARVVQTKLPVSAKLVVSRSLRPDVNVRLVLGRDMSQPRIAGWYEGDREQAAAPVGEDDGGRVAKASTLRVEPVASRAVAGGWRYL